MRRGALVDRAAGCTRSRWSTMHDRGLLRSVSPTPRGDARRQSNELVGQHAQRVLLINWSSRPRKFHSVCSILSRLGIVSYGVTHWHNESRVGKGLDERLDAAAGTSGFLLKWILRRSRRAWRHCTPCRRSSHGDRFRALQRST